MLRLLRKRTLVAFGIKDGADLRQHKALKAGSDSFYGRHDWTRTSDLYRVKVAL